MEEVKFKYFPNAIKEVFTTGDIQVCDCCGEEIDVYYEGPFYSEKEIEVLVLNALHLEEQQKNLKDNL